jgi:hypothetical protein
MVIKIAVAASVVTGWAAARAKSTTGNQLPSCPSDGWTGDEAERERAHRIPNRERHYLSPDWRRELSERQVRWCDG